jgi:hypothetical protein
MPDRLAYFSKVEPAYNENSLCGTSSIASDHVWYLFLLTITLYFPINHNIILVGYKDTPT